jgi:hypothetical protein
MNKTHALHLRLILALAVMTLFAGTAWAGGTPVQNPANGHYYDIISEGSMNWAAARADAQGRSYNGLQGHLVTITSEQERDFLRDVVSVPRNAWIGASQPAGSTEPAGGWEWVTGEAWNYTSWAPGEPNNSGGEGCAHEWSPPGTWNDTRCTNNYGNYVIEYESTGRLTTFAVTKEFTDSSTDEVNVTLTCSTGLPLTQTTSIAGGDPVGVNFVVTDIEAGANCSVTESGSPGGYTPVMNGGAGCSWQGVTGGAFSCEIVNEAKPGTFTVNMEWHVVNDGGDAVNDNTPVRIGCDSMINTSGAVNIPPNWYLEGVLGDGDHLTATVDTTTGSASCWATQSLTASGVEPSDNCGARNISAGGSSNCTFSNTVFFEGIPTLSQYGLVILALLMLSVGMVGFRRFA